MLFASLLALAAGPLFYQLLSRRREYLSLLDGFVFVSILGLLALEILPTLLQQAGWPALVFIVAGLFGPDLLERLFRRSARQVHISVLVLAVIGLVFHAVIDGIVLPGIEAVGAHADDSHGHGGHAHNGLSLAIVLHRIPVAITIWWLLKPTLGARVASSVLLLVGAGTVAGYALGDALLPAIPGQLWLWLQAFIAGAIMHVVFNRPHLADANSHEHSDCADERERLALAQQRREQRMEGLGNALGVIALVAVFMLEGEALETIGSWDTLQRFYGLALISAPALLLGYTIAGALSAWMPGASMRWLHRGKAEQQALRGMAVGLPLPVCSCGVVPLFEGLVAKGAPPAAALAFLIATPELGIDALLLSLPLLGGEFTLIRLVVAAVLAFLVAVLVSRIFKPVAIAKHTTDSCCASGDNSPELADSKPRWKKAVNDGLIELVDHTAPWILLGLIIAAFAEPLLSNSALTAIGAPWDVLLFALVGMPIYVCATGSTPIAAMLIAAGVSPGAGLAFLLTGPATNVTTFGILRNLYGGKVALGFGVAMFVASCVAGLLVNAWFADISLPAVADSHEHPSWYQQVALMLVTVLVVGSILRRGLREFVGTLRQSGAEHSHDHGGDVSEAGHHGHSH